MKRTRMRRVGKKGRARSKRLEAARPALEARSGGRCEIPWCRRRGPLDPHHIVKRSQGGDDTLDNLLHLCRRDHARADLPAEHPRRLHVERHQDALGRWFAVFKDGGLVQAVPLAVPEGKT